MMLMQNMVHVPETSITIVVQDAHDIVLTVFYILIRDNAKLFGCQWMVNLLFLCVHSHMQVGLHLPLVLGEVTAASFRVYWRQPLTLSLAMLVAHLPRHRAPTLRFSVPRSHYWPIVSSHTSAELSLKRYNCAKQIAYCCCIAMLKSYSACT